MFIMQNPVLLADTTTAIGTASYYEGVVQAEVAGLFMLITIFLAILVWFIVVRLPRPAKSSFPPRRQFRLARATIVFLIVAEAAAAWDIWWHRAVGRDSLWEVPHLWLYAGATAAIVAGFYGYWRTGQKKWRNLALALTLIPISAPFDQLWHTLFGVEDLTRPTNLAWAPPHLLISLASAIALISLFIIIRRDPNRSMRAFFGVLIFGTLMTPLQFIMMPFHPTEGWGQVLGFWGAGIFGAPLITIPLIAKQKISGAAIATRTMIIAMTFWMIMYGKQIAPDVILIPHDRAPNWLMLFGTIPAAAWLDVTTRLPNWFRLAIGNGLISFIILTFAVKFFSPEFSYPPSQVVIGVFSALVVGALIGLIIDTPVIKKHLTP